MAEVLATLIVVIAVVGVPTLVLIAAVWLIVGVLRGIAFFAERWPDDNG